MGSKPIQKDKQQEYFDGELVVAVEHLALVRDELGAAVGQVHEDERLGLALVELSDVDAAVATVRGRREENRADPAPRPAAPADLGGLNLLLFELRSTFEARYAGWSPTMGKNRVMEGIKLYPYISGGSDPAVEPRWPPRGKGPTELTNGAAPDAGQGVTVGLMDTRIFPHQAINGRYIASPASLIHPTKTVLPSWMGHSTFIAGLILKCAPMAALDVRSILDHENATASAWDVARRLIQYADSGVDVLNLSFGCFTDDGQAPLVLARAIDRLVADIVVVAAAGNYGAIKPGDTPLGPRTPIWPAALDGVLAVGATDGPVETASFSPNVPWVDVLAPGINVTSIYLEGEVAIRADEGSAERTETFRGHAEWSGTSFSAGIVTGAIAAHTLPNRRSAREALELIRQSPEIAAHYGIRAFKAAR